PKVVLYLSWSGATGGGSWSVTKIAMELFKRCFAKLSLCKWEAVLLTQENENKWRNDHTTCRIFATNCQKTVGIRDRNSCPMCGQCLAVRDLKVFKTALCVPVPDASNYIYNDDGYHNKELGLLFATCKGLKELVTPEALNGSFDDSKVFMGMVEAMTIAQEHKDCGMENRNFKYDPNYDDFCQMLCLTSPIAYHQFRTHF
ncbi:hypothetical protein K439DRAFT_1248578, partial [Ramaria rubella]